MKNEWVRFKQANFWKFVFWTVHGNDNNGKRRNLKNRRVNYKGSGSEHLKDLSIFKIIQISNECELHLFRPYARRQRRSRNQWRPSTRCRCMRVGLRHDFRRRYLLVTVYSIVDFRTERKDSNVVSSFQSPAHRRYAASPEFGQDSRMFNVISHKCNSTTGGRQCIRRIQNRWRTLGSAITTR